MSSQRESDQIDSGLVRAQGPPLIDWRDLTNRSVGCQTKHSSFSQHTRKRSPQHKQKALQKASKQQLKKETAQTVSQQLLQGMFQSKMSATRLEKFKAVFSNAVTFSSADLQASGPQGPTEATMT